MPDALLLREVREHLVVELVADADLDRVAGVQHVELGDGQGVEPVDPRRVAQADGVHPSAASRPARDRAELLAARAQQVGNVAAQLRGERAVPHPRAIGLGDADRPVDLGRGHARSRAGSARGRARRRDEGVRAVVEIQHGPLSTLEEHGGACLHPAVEEKGGVGDIGRQPSGIAEIRAQDALDGEALRVVDLAEEPVLLRHVVFELLAEQALVEEIGHADAHAGGLVGIGGPHALARGADAVLARLGLAGPVERGVIGHDHVRVLGDVEVAVEGNPALDERLHLLDQRGGIDDHAAADDVAAARVQDPRRDGLQHELLAPHHPGVSGVVAALKANDHVEVRREHVHHLALALVAPLRSHDHDVRHDALLPRPGSAGRDLPGSRR